MRITKKITLKSHLAIASPLIVIIGFTIFFVYMGINSGNEKYEIITYNVAIVFFILQFGPQLALHIQHYQYNHDLSIQVENGSDIVTIVKNGKTIKQSTADIEWVELHLPISVYNGGMRPFMCDDYYYGKLKLKGEDEPIIVTTLLDRHLALLKMFAPEKTTAKRRFFCMI